MKLSYRPPALSGFAWMAAASISFAFMQIFARMAHPDVPWAEVAAARGLIGAAVAIGVARMRGASLAIRDRPRAWARSLCGTISVVTTFYALGSPEIHVGDVATLGATSPIFIALLAPLLLGENGGWRVWASAPIAFIGVAVLIRPSLDINGHLALIALGGALSSAFAMIFLRKLSAGESPEAVVCHFSIVSGVILVLLSVPGWRTPSAAGLVLAAAAGLSGGLAQLAMTRAYALEQAARVGIFSYLGVLVTQALGAWILDEGIGPHQIIGALLVIAAGLIITRRG